MPLIRQGSSSNVPSLVPFGHNSNRYHLERLADPTQNAHEETARQVQLPCAGIIPRPAVFPASARFLSRLAYRRHPCNKET